MPEVVDRFGRKAACAELQLEQLGEIADEMILRRRISFPKTVKIGLVERKKFQKLPRSAGKYSREREWEAMDGADWQKRTLQNETDSRQAALLAIGLLEGSGDLHAGIIQVPRRAPEAASGTDC